MKNIGLLEKRGLCLPGRDHCAGAGGRLENFTVGRNIEWERVREIYRLGFKHGMQLAEVSGVNGVFSDADIAQVRKLALAARKKATRAAAKTKEQHALH